MSGDLVTSAARQTLAKYQSARTLISLMLPPAKDQDIEGEAKRAFQDLVYIYIYGDIGTSVRMKATALIFLDVEPCVER